MVGESAFDGKLVDGVVVECRLLRRLDQFRLHFNLFNILEG